MDGFFKHSFEFFDLFFAIDVKEIIFDFKLLGLPEHFPELGVLPLEHGVLIRDYFQFTLVELQFTGHESHCVRYDII